MIPSVRVFCSCLGLALAVPWCGSLSQTEERGLPLATPVIATRVSGPAPPRAEPVAPRIQALLDTTAAGSLRAANTRLGLLAAAEVRQFFGDDYAPAWTPLSDSLNPDATAALTRLARATEYGLGPADYHQSRLRTLRDSLAQPPGTIAPAVRARQQAALEVYLSDALLRLLRDLSRGRLHPYTPTAREKAAGPAGQPAAVLRAALAAHRVPEAIDAAQPTHREYRQLQRALVRWLAQPTNPDSADLQQARYQQVALNLERWRWNPIADPEYLLINLPAYELQVVAGDSVRRRHRVIVGKPETPTPTLSSQISYFTLAPDWHVPNSIATKEVLPSLRKNPGYLARNNMTLYNRRGQALNPYRINWARVSPANFPYTFRQSACCDNALGNIVFRFKNPYSVYLHDTPARSLFERPVRTLSHGCIRMAAPMELAAYLLRRGGQPVSLPSEAACARQPTPRDVQLRRAMPIHVRYATCTVAGGQLRFLPDIYRYDEVVRQGLFGPLPSAAAWGGEAK
ncbi:L,D-transpeptidase family protein [Hymenobacter antarcticus]|uniref:L,D-TPase catalytic domain-containing protein n=1 Tax=Hymenobacter antarcticus TaxID=486270 RepID=A0ABP7PJ87_9BACT